MSPGEPGSDAARSSCTVLRVLPASCVWPLNSPTNHSLERLQQVVTSLGLSTTARPPRGSGEYLQDWQRYLADPQQRSLPHARMRYLCWEPEVAMTSRFQEYLEQAAGELGGTCSARLGALLSCACWSPAFAAGAVARRVQQRLANVHGNASGARPLARARHHAPWSAGALNLCELHTHSASAHQDVLRRMGD